MLSLLRDPIVSPSRPDLPRYLTFILSVNSYLKQQELNGTCISAQAGCLQGGTSLESFPEICAIFVSFAVVQSILDTYMLRSFRLAICFRAGWFLLSPVSGSYLAPSLVSTSLLHPLASTQTPTQCHSPFLNQPIYHVQVTQSSYCNLRLHQIYS